MSFVLQLSPIQSKPHVFLWTPLSLIGRGEEGEAHLYFIQVKTPIYGGITQIFSLDFCENKNFYIWHYA